MVNFVDWWTKTLDKRDVNKMADRSVRLWSSLMSNIKLYDDQELQGLYLAMSSIQGQASDIRQAVTDLQIERAQKAEASHG